MAPGPDRVLDLVPVVRVDLAAPDLVGLRVLLPVVRAAPHPAGRVEHTDPAGLPQVVRADLHLVDQAELGQVDLAAPAVRGARADTNPLGLVVPVGPGHLVVRLDLMVARLGLVRVDRAERDPVARVDRMVPVDTDPAARVDRMVPVDTDPADLARADPVGLADRVVRVDPAVPVVPAVLMDPVDLVAREDPVDRRRRPMCSMAHSIGVAPNSAVRGMRRTASAHPITVLRHRPGNMGSVGTTGLLPGVLRRTGTVRRPPVAGTVRRLPVVGTRDGTVRAAI
jgi:hypothetical protein